MWTLLISCLIHSFLEIEKKVKTRVFLTRESLPFLYIDLKWRAKLKIFRILIRDSDWLNFIHFSGYKYKFRLASRLRKRKDQALISISTILKFPAQIVKLTMKKKHETIVFLDKKRSEGSETAGKRQK